MRALKVQVSRAANRADRKDLIRYGENEDGELGCYGGGLTRGAATSRLDGPIRAVRGS